jgi:O-antigen/teichoic acid export membrane protein
MAFLIASFLAFKQLLDMASSSAFFTFISQKTRSKKFIIYYWRWIGIQFLFSLFFVMFLLSDSVLDLIWKDEDKFIIVLALVATFMQQHVWSIALQMAEAQRETARVQRLNTLVVLMHLGVVVILWFGGKLILPLIFVALIIEWSIASWVATRMYRGNKTKNDKDDTAISVFKEFWHYCLPFLPYAWLGFLHDFLDRWMLQNWGGSDEQAYYAIAYQFSSIALLATVSVLKIFWKEIAEAQYNNNFKKVKRLYLKISRGLYFIGSLVAGGLLPWSEEIVNLLLGQAYIDGIFTLMLMFLYPVHQSMGQIGSTMLYATGRTKLQAIIGSVFMLISIIFAYILMAPTTAFGLEMASQGLAVKMVVMQLIQVNIMAWFIAKAYKWKFDWIYQVAALGLSVIAGWTVKALITSIIAAQPLILMLISGVVYILIMALIVKKMPWIAGLSQQEADGYFLESLKFLRVK